MTNQPPMIRVAPAKDKSLGVAYALWLTLGWIGCHQYYLGRVGRGAIYSLTIGVFLIGWFVDLFTLPQQVARVRARGY